MYRFLSVCEPLYAYVCSFVSIKFMMSKIIKVIAVYFVVTDSVSIHAW